MPSRRQLLQASALASGLGALGFTASTAQAAISGPVCAYVGTYSDGGKPWRGGRGLGVHQFVADGATGALKPIPGAPTLVREEWTRGNYPRSCTLDPGGRFLYVCHDKQGDNVTVFRVKKGDIQFTGQYVAVGSAVAIEFSS